MTEAELIGRPAKFRASATQILQVLAMLNLSVAL
jgi:hypothetical protein